MMKDVLNNFKEIEVEKPVDKIIRQIRDLIASGQLNPGDKLPSERQLSERLGIGRTHVRDAIRKLEFYGILKTLPQSGSVVAGIGLTALEGLITDILKLEDAEFYSLVATRVVLEKETCRLAAIHRTDKDILELKQVLDSYKTKVVTGDPAVEEDFMFHMKIAEISKNGVMKSLMMIIAPEIMQIYRELQVCDKGKANVAYDEHIDLFNSIVERDSEKAAHLMSQHLQGILEFSKTQKK